MATDQPTVFLLKFTALLAKEALRKTREAEEEVSDGGAAPVSQKTGISEMWLLFLAIAAFVGLLSLVPLFEIIQQ